MTSSIEIEASHLALAYVRTTRGVRAPPTGAPSCTPLPSGVICLATPHDDTSSTREAARSMAATAAPRACAAAPLGVGASLSAATFGSNSTITMRSSPTGRTSS